MSDLRIKRKDLKEDFRKHLREKEQSNNLGGRK